MKIKGEGNFELMTKAIDYSIQAFMLQLVSENRSIEEAIEQIEIIVKDNINYFKENLEGK